RRGRRGPRGGRGHLRGRHRPDGQAAGARGPPVRHDRTQVGTSGMSASPSSEPTSPAVPTCYRHPGRETYVRCRLCDRYICPDCMREDAVGFQCVECVAKGNRNVRGARGVFGGRVSAKLYVTWVVLGLIGAVSVAQVVSAGSPGLVATRADGLVLQFGMWGQAVVVWGQWYRLLPGALLHGGVMHLLF